MGALGLLVRRSLRANRRAVLGLALVVALAGGVALTSLAAARRTASAFPRYLEASNASDLAVNVATDDNAADNAVDGSLTATLAFADKARALPEVVRDATYIGLEYVFLVDATGVPLEDQPEVIGSLDGRFIDQDRLAVLEGRLPEPDRIDEVAINRGAAARLHLHLGSTVELVVPDVSDGVDLDQVDPRDVKILDRRTARVTAIGMFPEEVLSDDFDGSARLLTTPAYTARFLDSAGSYFWQGLQLAPGTSVDEALHAYESILDDGYLVNVQRTDTQVDRVQRSVRPVAVALGVFGAAAALAALALAGLGIVRIVGAGSGGQDQVLRAVGLSGTRRMVVTATPAIAAALLGVIGAVALAVALSPLAPVGAVREVEPSRGVDLDATVVLLGGLAVALLLVALSVVAAGRAIRQSRSGEAPARPSWLVGRMAAAGFGPVAVVGAGHALGGQGRRDGVPTRSTLVACTMSVVALASAITFGASVRSVLHTPRTYGWAADLAVESGGGYDYLDLEGAPAAAATPGIDGLTVAGFGPLAIGKSVVNGTGIAAIKGDPLVTVVRGRLPGRPDELALGASTAGDLGLEIDDRVEAGGRRLRVVGIVALPAIGPLASSHPSLGQGALLTMDGLVAANENAYPSVALVKLGKGVDIDEAGPRVVAAVETMAGRPPGYGETYQHLRPSEVVGLGPASRTANLLAGLLGAAAALALALTLSASVRRRRRTYAVLSALGIDRGGLRRTVRWQVNLVTLLALAVGLPVGVVAGRLAWTAFADQLGTASGARVPLLLLGATAAGLLVLANLVGEGPARMASRRRTDLTLQP